MIGKNFNGFKSFYEQRFSNFSRTLMNKFNIDVKDAGDKVGSIPIAPNAFKFQLKEKPPWESQWENGMIKWYEIIEIGEHSVKVKEVTGKCNNQGGNINNIMAQCSPTSDQQLTLTGKQFDWLMAHISGQPAGGGMSGMPGGMI